MDIMRFNQRNAQEAAEKLYMDLKTTDYINSGRVVKNYRVVPEE